MTMEELRLLVRKLVQKTDFYNVWLSIENHVVRE
jgi:hypothetical protein